MEGLTQRIKILVGLFAVAGVWYAFSKVKEDTKSEQQLIAMAPIEVAGQHYVVNEKYKSEGVSDKQPEVVYTTLQPFGIVVRDYEVGTTLYDTVMIASRSKDSFHDPRVCFSAQGWSIEKFDSASVESKVHGTVPITMIKMSGNGQKDKLAAFFYKGPGNKFYGSTQVFKSSLFWEVIRGGQDIDGVFYRFMTISGSPSEDDLKKFIGQFLDEASVSSKGYF